MYNSNKNIDKELVNIKVAIHNLEKLGCDTKDLEKTLDNIGAEFYKFKVENKDTLKKSIRLDYKELESVNYEK